MEKIVWCMHSWKSCLSLLKATCLDTEGLATFNLFGFVWINKLTCCPMVHMFFFPNSFSYEVLANIGSGAVPVRLPNHGFREGSGAGSGAMFRDRVPGTSGQVPGQCSGKVLGRVSSSGQGSKVPGQCSKEVPGGFRGSRQGSRRGGSRTY